MQKIVCLLLAVSLSCTLVFSQEKDTTWKKGGVLNVGLNNTGYSDYWQAGPLNALAIGGRVNVFANRKLEKLDWQNEFIFGLGAVRQGDASESDFIKSDDRIEINSKLGRKISNKLLFSGLVGFKTQLLNGFRLDPKQPTVRPDQSQRISTFFAPAYLNFGLGLDYQPSENTSIYYSPINSKLTIVGIEELRPLYIPQTVTTGAVRYEIGSLLGIKYRRKIMENVTFQTAANFFANYLEKFGNVDVNWETLTAMQVNKYLAVTFSTNFIYDDDVKFDIVEGTQPARKAPRSQFQHVLNVGFTYNFIK